VRAHEVPPRWSIPEQTFEVRAACEQQARIEAAREAHRRGGLPPWKPCLRVTWRHVTVERASSESRMRREAA
jgi:hypothetical protein